MESDEFNDDDRVHQAYDQFLEEERQRGKRPRHMERTERFVALLRQDYPEVVADYYRDLEAQCDQYLRAAKKIHGAPRKDADEEITAASGREDQIRFNAVWKAYADFKKKTKFKGTVAAESMAFQTFAETHHSELDGVTTQEAYEVMAWHNQTSRRASAMAAMLLTLIGTAGAHKMFTPGADDKPEPPPPLIQAPDDRQAPSWRARLFKKDLERNVPQLRALPTAAGAYESFISRITRAYDAFNREEISLGASGRQARAKRFSAFLEKQGETELARIEPDMLSHYMERFEQQRHAHWAKESEIVPAKQSEWQR